MKAYLLRTNSKALYMLTLCLFSFQGPNKESSFYVTSTHILLARHSWDDYKDNWEYQEMHGYLVSTNELCFRGMERG